MTDPSTTTLVRDFASGRREAFRALYARVAPKLFVWCALRIPPPLQVRIDPEDLMQEIWLRSVRAMPRFDRSVAAFRAWLFGIAAKTLAETLRHLNVRRREREPGALDLDGLPAEVTSVLGEVARREQTANLIAACRELPDEERSLLIYRGIEELPHAEVARLLGVTPEAAEMRWRRLASRLRSAWSAAGLDEA
ncbi:MAG: sigma-70 family RNA polymerase sigma factor [bacterium]|nr:sigma-70 family RNA polymerase sigma factor [bacterium]